MASQSIPPETTLSVLFSTHTYNSVRQYSLFVGGLKCSQLEGVVGEQQKVAGYRSCTKYMEKFSCQAFCCKNPKHFLWSKTFSVLFDDKHRCIDTLL
jgi:hypothetical protein